MRVPLNKIADMAKLGATTVKQSDDPVRVAVIVDDTATPFLIQTVRDAFVPQTTSAIVRVSRIADFDAALKRDTDIVLVLTCGSDALQDAVQRIVIAGAPVAVLCESSVEVPFIEQDTKMLGLVSATDETTLLETLARWILDHTEKQTAFAANFPFMRIAAANRVVTSSMLTNMATGALFFVPGADYPVMVAAQIGMMIQLASIFGKPLSFDRVYDAAGILASGLGMRAITRQLCRSAGHYAFAVKAVMAAGGTYAMGRALCSLYESDTDYSRANDVVSSFVSFVKRNLSTKDAQQDVVDTTA